MSSPIRRSSCPRTAIFMMGDHRSISSDSRDFGPVERDLIYGKAVFVYWPAQDAGRGALGAVCRSRPIFHRQTC